MSQLFENKFAAIKISNFLDQNQCQRLINSIDEIGIDYYENVYPPIGKIGITQYEHSQKNKNIYFAKVQEANRKQQLLFKSTQIQAFLMVQRLFSNSLQQQVKVAYEPNIGNYFAGLVRDISAANLHFDYAPYDANGWYISAVKNQIAWNIYLQIPTGQDGGEIKIANMQWEDQKYNQYQLPGHQGSYGFSQSLIEGVDKCILQPQQGDLILFNSRNFHEVMLAKSKRRTLSSFLGKISNSEYVLWS